MIEIQCTSCHTRYRIDERVLPDETPTFKCSRCGHVFNASPAPARPRKPALQRPEKPKAEEEPQVAAEPATPEVPPASEPKPSAAESRPAKRPAKSAAVSPQAPESAKEENPLDRSFARDRDESSEAGENLSFDFRDEPGNEDRGEEPEQEHNARPDDHWEVGDLPDDASMRSGPAIHSTLSLDEPAPPAAPKPDPIEPAGSRRGPFIDELPRAEFGAPPPDAPDERRAAADDRASTSTEAQFATSRTVHSSGWFIGLFAAVAVMFGLASLIFHMEPAAIARLLSLTPRIGTHFQRPMVPAMRVALHDVHADYEPIKGGQTALLISGTAENLGAEPLHAVLLAVDLLDGGGRQIASNAVYCGNGLTPAMVSEMTPREIEFLQRLDPQKNFAVSPSKAAPFLMVFIDPPRRIANLRIQVAKADAQAAPSRS